jgi:fructokinase
VIDGEILQGLSHPEMGHMRVERHRDDTYAGICPLHGECLEGLASGPAIARRWGRALSDLPDDHPGHDMIAFYLAQACVNLQALLAPGRIVLGGGVTETPSLIERVRKAADKLSGGYFRGEPDQIIVGAALSPRSGLIGAWALAQSAALRSS